MHGKSRCGLLRLTVLCCYWPARFSAVARPLQSWKPLLTPPAHLYLSSLRSRTQPRPIWDTHSLTSRYLTCRALNRPLRRPFGLCMVPTECSGGSQTCSELLLIVPGRVRWWVVRSGAVCIKTRSGSTYPGPCSRPNLAIFVAFKTSLLVWKMRCGFNGSILGDPSAHASQLKVQM